MLNWLYRKLWANRIRKVSTVAVLAAALALAGVFLPPVLDRLDRCAEGVEESAGECIGVNGSGYDFGTPEITKVARAIAAENERIAGKPHITVAMMLPLQPKSSAGREQLRSDVQGAYLAQYKVNRQEQSPKMRLVLANPGAGYRQHAQVVDRLAEMADSPKHNLRAVTGFNLSLETTEEAVGRLTNELGIPVLASRISADGIANEEGAATPRFPGLARVIPTNQKQADALAEFHGDLADRDTVLVRDTREGDIYVESLARAFSRDEPGPPGPKDQEFRSTGINEKGETGNDFSLIGHNICQSDAELVYFAGRPVHLRLFVLKLAEVPCSGKHYTVVSGSGAATLERYMSEDDWRKLAGDGSGEPVVTVQYAAPGHPESWDHAVRAWQADREADGAAGGKKRAEEEPPAYLTEPRRETEALRLMVSEQRAGDIGPTDLQDSRTMLVYDGVRTIAEAVFLANTQTEDPIPTRERVAAQWARLESAHRVVGTSGWICLTNAGNPYDKPVSVVELDPVQETLTFVGLGWSEGHPQPPDCVVPSGTD